MIQVRAIDTDIGNNGAVRLPQNAFFFNTSLCARYRIRKDPLGHHLTFKMDPLSGQITLAKPLDRERQKVYELRVEAHDLGLPTPLQSDLDLTVYVKNINDHEPKFIVDTFRVNFTENKAPGAERARLLNTVDLDDEDEDDVKVDVCYFLVGGPSKDLFAVTPDSHEVLALVQLDREEEETHRLIVKATEECLHTPEDVEDFDPSDDSLLSVVVYVNDINDNAPIFSQQVFTGGISTDIDFGTAFMTIHALDSDYENTLQYSLCSPITPIVSEGFEPSSLEPFAVDSASGDILLNFDPQTHQKGHFTFSVCVKDEGGLSDRAEVFIYLLREDQRVKFVMRSHPEEIRAKMRQFRSVLSNATDAIVNVDHFKVHENQDGSIDKTKTDVLLHFVNPLDNTIMEVHDVIRTLDYRTEELDPFFKEFNVLQTEGADPLFSTKTQHSTEMVLVLWLAGLTAFLSITLIVVLCVCLSQRQRYTRALKAATTAAYGARAGEGGKEVVPNTNRHATEGSNPVWMTGVGYDNWAAEHDDDDEEDILEEQPPRYDQFDSLDANVLNDSYEDKVHNERMDRLTEEGEEVRSVIITHIDFLTGGEGAGALARRRDVRSLPPQRWRFYPSDHCEEDSFPR